VSPSCLRSNSPFAFMQRNLSMVMLQDEDFVAGKDDGGSPTDDSGDGESDASESGDEKEASHSIHSTCMLY